MNPTEQFKKEVQTNIKSLQGDNDLQGLSKVWVREITRHRYTYNFQWLGRPIIQFPQDVVAMQEIIWNTKPDLIIETGIAHGGSLILHSSILELAYPEGKVLGVDIEIRPHNREAIEKHPYSKRIELVEGSSISEEVISIVRDRARTSKRTMVILDSNHTHEHVMRELELYAPLVSQDCFLIVFDTIVEDMPETFFPNQPWGKGNNPKTAVREYLKLNKDFIVDPEYDAKLLISCAPEGYLRRVTPRKDT